MRGDPGSAGDQGPKGEKGANGTQGPPGEKGDKVSNFCWQINCRKAAGSLITSNYQ